MSESIVRKIYQMREEGLEKESILESLQREYMAQHNDLEKLVDEYIFNEALQKALGPDTTEERLGAAIIAFILFTVGSIPMIFSPLIPLLFIPGVAIWGASGYFHWKARAAV